MSLVTYPVYHSLKLFRKATASSRAIEERQAFEKLKREHKINTRTLTNLQTKNEEFDAKQTTLLQEYETWKEKATLVSYLHPTAIARYLLIMSGRKRKGWQS